MDVIRWKGCYDIGIATFDDEHHNLVEVINALYVAMREKRGDAALDSLLQQLVDYTEKHFAHEEEVMDRYFFEASEDHCKEHRDLVRTIRDFQQQRQQDGAELSGVVMKFLREWLLNHIVETDMALGKFLRSRGIYDCGPAHV